jgi:hypothetical protein
MEEPQPPSISETPTTVSTSLPSRLTNVFVSPGEVFDEVKSSPVKPANWVVPLILSMVVGVIYTFVVFSQPAISQKMREAQEEKFQELVEAKKMTQQDADRTIVIVQKVTKIMVPVFAIVGSAGILFLAALIFWAVGLRALGGHFDYMKAVEALGLASMISILGSIIAMLLAVIYGDMMMTLGPALLIKPLDAANKMHRILSALNVMSIWWLAVVSIALARLSGSSFVKAALWVFGIWAVLTFGPILAFGGK